MRVFKSRWFQRFARKEGISDAVLLEAVARAETRPDRRGPRWRGYQTADCPAGSGEIERVSGHHLFRRGARAFLAYGFAIRQRANIDHDEEREFKEAAKHVLALTEKQLAELLKRGDFLEVKSE